MSPRGLLGAALVVVALATCSRREPEPGPSPAGGSTTAPEAGPMDRRSSDLFER